MNFRVYIKRPNDKNFRMYDLGEEEIVTKVFHCPLYTENYLDLIKDTLNKLGNENKTIKYQIRTEKGKIIYEINNNKDDIFIFNIPFSMFGENICVNNDLNMGLGTHEQLNNIAKRLSCIEHNDIPKIYPKYNKLKKQYKLKKPQKILYGNKTPLFIFYENNIAYLITPN